MYYIFLCFPYTILFIYLSLLSTSVLCLFISFLCTIHCTFCILYSCTIHILYFHTIFIYYVFIYCTFHMLFIYFICHIHFVSLTLYFLCLYTCHILSSHSSAMLLISYHIFCTCHFILGFMSANTLEADTGNYVYPKVLSLYKAVISVC